MAVAVGTDGIHINGAVYPLYSGSVHYWRHDPRIWGKILDRVVEMGFRFLSAAIPWSVHEIDKGVFSFGKSEDSKNIGKFLDLCSEKSLFVLVQPGPQVGAELTYFGYPERILRRDDILARTAEGTHAIVPAPPRFFPAPSYASPGFYEEVGIWFDAVCSVLAPRQYPDGPVVGVQTDNEMSLFRRTQPFDLDYSDAAVKLYHDFLRRRHADIGALNELYGQRHARFRDILPPREFTPKEIRNLPYYVEWVEFREFLVYYGINRVASMLKARGMDRMFTFHTYPCMPGTPFHLAGTEASALELVGAECRAGRGDYAHVRDLARSVFADSRLPFISGLGAGGRLWALPLEFEDQRFATLSALMNGVRALNHDMLADRDRWFGAPLARDGRRRTRRFEFLGALNRFLNETGFHKGRMQAQGLLLRMRDYERFESLCSLLSPLPHESAPGMPGDWFCTHPPIEGMPESPLRLYRRQWRALQRGFSQAGITMAYADSDVSADVLQQHRLVVAPSFEFMNTALQKRLLVYALKGGVLVLGPRVPVLDEYMRPSSRFSSHLPDSAGYVDELDYNGMMLQRAQVFEAAHPFVESQGKCVGYERSMERGAIIFLGFVFPDYTGIERLPHVTELARRVAARAGIEPLYQPDDPLVETVLHTGGNMNLLFVANPAPESRAVTIHLGPGESLRDWYTHESLPGPGAHMTLKSQSVRVFVVNKTGVRPRASDPASGAQENI